MDIDTTLLNPFGCLVQSPSSQSALSVPITQIDELLKEHRLLLMRGFERLSREQLVTFAERLGSILEWEFGPILELKINADPANHIFSSARVELHWDGAFIDDKPRYNLFQCLRGAEAGEGGETLFVDTAKAYAEASEEQKKQWQGKVINYTTEKKAHYGGHIEEQLVSINPHSDKPILRYIEAFNEDNEALNPMTVTVQGMNTETSDGFLRDLNNVLYSPELLYRHQWQAGDILVADNTHLLHGRSRFQSINADRLIQRINVI